MSQHWLSFWYTDGAEATLREGLPLRHIASRQLHKVDAGDVLWIVSVVDGNLIVYNRFAVDRQVSFEEACRIARRNDINADPDHAFAPKGAAEPLRRVSAQSLAPQLRFISPTGKDRLSLKKGRVNPLQLRTLRRLTEPSAEALEILWRKKPAARF